MLPDDQAKLVTFNWEEGKYFDLWMVVHFLSGTTLAFFFSFLGVSVVLNIVFSLILFVAWEYFEIFFGIRETFVNHIMDVVVDIVGFTPALLIASSVLSGETIFALFLFSAILFLGLALLGFLDYRERSKKGV